MKRAFRRKNAISVAVAILLILSMVACQGKQVIEEPESSADFSGQPVSPAEVQPAEDTAALYELAKAEGQVVIYSVSSRISAFQEDFEKTYPGISVEAYKLKTGDIITKVKTEKDAGNVNADVVYTRDISGAMKIDFMANGYLNSYLPGDIQEKMYEPFKSNADTAIGYVELRTIFYNTDAYPDGSPIQNWWDLTTDEWRGRLIMQDPLLISDTMDLFMAFSQHSDEMAAAYKLKFGEDLALSEGCKDAGYEFVKRLLANDPVLMSSEGDCTTAVGLSKEAKAPVAIAVSSKMRDAIDDGMPMAIAYDVEPVTSVIYPTYLYVAEDAPHPNAAKLLIWYMAGGADGKTEGSIAYQTDGGYPARSDIPIVGEGQPPLSELKLWEYDAPYYYRNQNEMRDFWLSIQ